VLPLAAAPNGNARVLNAGLGRWWMVPVLVLGLIALQLLFSLPLDAPAQSAPVDVFQARLETYLALRHGIEDRLPRLRVTSDSAEILRRERRLQVAMQASRWEARPGDLFDAAAVTAFRRAVAADWQGRSFEEQAALTSETPQNAPIVNGPYPADASLATFPGLLLHALPALPDSLEYRFMGRDLAIRDETTNLIVDYVTDAIPATRFPKPRDQAGRGGFDVAS